MRKYITTHLDDGEGEIQKQKVEYLAGRWVIGDLPDISTDPKGGRRRLCREGEAAASAQAD